MSKQQIMAILSATALLLTCGCSMTPPQESTADAEITTTSTTTTNSGEKTTETTSSHTTVSQNNITTSTASTLDELKDAVANHVADTIDSLYVEYDLLTVEVDTFEKRADNAERVEAFYDNVYVTTSGLCITLCQYAADFAKIALSSDDDCDEIYDQFDDLYDWIYDDAGDEIYDEIYDGLLDDMYDYYYDGILEDAYDIVSYSEWSDVRSDEYKWWSDTRGDVYDEWSDSRSDIYDFWSDIRSALWDDDLEKARDELNDFQDDIAKQIEKMN
ncbi:MAG: hypothetical protein IJC75_02515 [Oscillospiraceae bacterium]|nr:hypothetical protein [Oscillospiraceae bacterium]